jgi:hypothetical protein
MTIRRLLALLAFLACISPTYGKGSPDLILITGGGLAQPIEITDSSSLKACDSWMVSLPIGNRPHLQMCRAPAVLFRSSFV